MEKYIIKHGTDNMFLSKKKNLQWSTSLLNAKEFTNINAVLDKLNELLSTPNQFTNHQIIALTPLSKEKLKYINENYKSRDFNSTDIK